MSYQNLLSSSPTYLDAYLHNSPRTFNNAASIIDIAGFKKKNNYSEGIALFKKLEEQALKVEDSFFSLFEGINTPEEWSDRYLARVGENADPAQQVLAIWNSRIIREQIKGLYSREEIIEKLQKTILTDRKISGLLKEMNLTTEYNKILAEVETRASFSVRKILSDLLVGATKNIKDTSQIKTLQLAIREAFNQDIRKKKLLTSKNSSILKELESNIIYKTSDFNERKEQVYRELLKELSAMVGLTPIELEREDGAYKKYLDIIKQILNDASEKKNRLFSSNTSVMIGEVEETADGNIFSLSLELDLPFKKTNNYRDLTERGILSTGSQKIKRLGGKRVDSKIDMWINLPEEAKSYRFQQKNTDKDLFLEFENLGKQFDYSNERIFFNIGSEIKYTTFLQNLITISKQGWGIADDDILGKLSYLLVNLNVLNQGLGKDKLYKQETDSRSGLLLTTVNDTIARLISQAALLLFSDFEEDVIEGVYKKNTYDFIIFNSRFLIPMSRIYRAIRQSLEQYKIQLSKNTAFLSIDSKITGFTSESMNKIVEEKKEAVKEEGGFKKDGNYLNTKLVEAGKKGGKLAIENLILSGFKLDVNITSYLDSANLMSYIRR